MRVKLRRCHLSGLRLILVALAERILSEPSPGREAETGAEHAAPREP